MYKVEKEQKTIENVRYMYPEKYIILYAKTLESLDLLKNLTFGVGISL